MSKFVPNRLLELDRLALKDFEGKREAAKAENKKYYDRIISELHKRIARAEKEDEHRRNKLKQQEEAA